MKTIALQLFKAQDGLDAYAIALPDPGSPGLPSSWLAQKGFGSDFEKVWTLEIQGHPDTPPDRIDWNAVLERAIEASQLSDPVIASYQWPLTTRSATMALPSLSLDE